MTPPRLDATVGIDGFSATLPRGRLGSNSSWILLFVPLWWAVWGGVGLAAEESGFAAWLPLEAVFAFWGLGLGGWAVGWPLFDFWQAGRPGKELVADGLGLTVDDRQVSWSQVASIDNRFELRITVFDAADLTFQRYGLNGLERRWLAENLQSLRDRYTHTGDVPKQLQGLREPS